MIFELFIKKFEKVEKPKKFANEDDLYTFAHEAFSSIASEIEQEIEFDKDDYCDGEEWYDEYHDEVVQLFMQQLVK
jgi:hypothetical protein